MAQHPGGIIFLSTTPTTAHSPHAFRLQKIWAHANANIWLGRLWRCRYPGGGKFLYTYAPIYAPILRARPNLRRNRFRWRPLLFFLFILPHRRCYPLIYKIPETILLPSPTSLPKIAKSNRRNAASTSSRRSTSCDLDDQSASNKIKRPSNPYILFRQDYIKAEKDPANKKDGKNWSQESAAAWKGMSEEQRKPWKTKANLQKIKHTETYPNYKFQPKTSVKRKKHSKLTKRQKLKSSRTARKHSLSTSAASDISQPRSLECERIGDTSSSTGSSVVYPQVVQDDLEIIHSAFAPANVVETNEDVSILDWLSSPPPLDGVFDSMDMLNVPELLSPSTSSSVDSYVSIPSRPRSCPFWLVKPVGELQQQRLESSLPIYRYSSFAISVSDGRQHPRYYEILGTSRRSRSVRRRGAGKLRTFICTTRSAIFVLRTIRLSMGHPCVWAAGRLSSGIRPQPLAFK